MSAAAQLVRFMERRLCSLAGLSSGIAILFTFVAPHAADAQHPARRFSVADDIGLTRFADPLADSVLFSPDRKSFVVISERGRLDLNRPEASLRIYCVDAVRKFLSNRDAKGEPSPLWTVTRSTYKNGPLVSGIRWLRDSSGLAFLLKTAFGNNQLLLADIDTRTVHALTPEDRHVMGFDIRSRGRYVYTVLSPAIRKKAEEENRSAAIVGTGRNIESLIFPEGSVSPSVWVHDLSELWAVIDGRRFRVADPSSGQALLIHLEGQRALALSPDGRRVVTALSVASVPPEWEALYPPPFPSFPYRIRAGQYDPGTLNGQRDISEYVLVDLATGNSKPLTDAPLGNSAGWWGYSHADWSSDGQALVLSDTFLPPERQGLIDGASRPCVAVVDFATKQRSCIERLPDSAVVGLGDDWSLIYNVRFTAGNKKKVTVEHLRIDEKQSTRYVQLDDGSWTAEAASNAAVSREDPFDVFVKEGLNTPPVVIASDKKTAASRLVWDPNPQLRNVKLGEVSVFQWKDQTGRNWVAGLYKPPDYAEGKRYPLVIQTHGFEAGSFTPSGASTTAFAAQELAAAGIVVLQFRDCPIRGTPEEGPCQVAGYESAVRILAADGLVDPGRVGIIGFSRTCYYVLEALTTSALRFKAAAITDGVNQGYLQYLINVDGDSSNSTAHEADAMIGMAPFGAGLYQWLRQSPEFNLDKVATPLEVVATRQQVLQMWEPYAALRYLHKPVELLVLNSDEHVFSNPAERAASQGGTVDWFRFWLKEEEDPDSAKSAQYARWRGLRLFFCRAQERKPK